MTLILAPIILLLTFLAIGTVRHTRKMDNRQFFLMDRKASVTQYSDTTVAYSLQVAVTVYFVFWGYTYGWSNLFFVISWGLGLFLFGLTSTRLAEAISEKETLFKLIAGKSRQLRVLSGVVFGCSLVGLFYTEMFFSAQLFSSVIDSTSQTPGGSQSYRAVFLALLVVVLAYASIGGMRKVVLTDRWQLAAAYVSAAIFFASMAPSVAAAGTGAYNWAYFPIVVLFVLLALTPAMAAFREEKKLLLFPPHQSKVTTIAALLGAGIVFLTAIYYSPSDGVVSTNFPKSVFEMVKQPHGIWPIIGFGVANLLWQFSDYTAYHRLTLLNLPNDLDGRARTVKQSIVSTMLRSPLTWSFGIFAGMIIDASGMVPPTSVDIFGSFTTIAIQNATEGDVAFNIGVIALSCLFMSVLLSTVDSSFISLGQIAVNDILGNEVGYLWRYGILVCIGLLVLILLVVHSAFELDVFTLLNSIYSWGLIFAPIVLTRLFAKNFSTQAAGIAILGGAAIGAYGSTNPFDLPYLVAMVFPTLAAIFGAATLMWIGNSIAFHSAKGTRQTNIR